MPVGEIITIFILLNGGLAFVLLDSLKEFRTMGYCFITGAVLLLCITYAVPFPSKWKSDCVEKHLRYLDYADQPAKAEWICLRHAPKSQE